MKTALEVLLIISLVAVGVYVSISDIKRGVIKNKVLFIFAGVAAFLDVFYYGFFVRDIAVEFIISYGIVAAMALILFFTHCWAGGDCKLALVLGLMFPARFYVITWKTNVTLFFALMIAFLLGYIFLLIDAVYGLISRRDKISAMTFRQGMTSFFKYYIAALAYLIAIDLLYSLGVARFVVFDSVIVSIICFAAAWGSTAIKPLMKPFVFLPVLGIDIVLCIVFRVFPLSGSIFHYIVILLLAIFRILISAKNYIPIQVDSVKTGMILSTASSILLSQSIPKVEIPISTEKLDSRLTEEQAGKIVEWGRNKKMVIAIVRRIPFAVFIVLGFILYLLWGGLSL